MVAALGGGSGEYSVYGSQSYWAFLIMVITAGLWRPTDRPGLDSPLSRFPALVYLIPYLNSEDTVWLLNESMRIKC